MNIVDAPAGYLTVDEAAGLAARSTKTLRRAVQDGHLPRRYVMGPRGPQLMFVRAELDSWLEGRTRRESAPHAGTRRSALVSNDAAAMGDIAVFMQRVAQLQMTLEENRSTIAQLTARLQQQDGAVARAHAAISHFARQLANLERGAERSAGAEGHTETEVQHFSS